MGQQRNNPLFFLLFFFYLLLLPSQTLSFSSSGDGGVFFLKTHKTGSSTFSSILKRFAVNFQLKTPLEVNEATFHTKTLPPRYKELNSTIGNRGPPFEVWANHIRLPYGLESAKLLVPTVQEIITAVRDPPDRFASYVCYFDRQCDLKLTDAPWAKRGTASKRMGAMDLNHREIINTTHSNFTDFILRLREHHDTPFRVIVMERFEESMALFSLDLGLSPFDVAYNVMKKKDRPGLKPEVRTYLTNYQPRDVALYKAANEQLERRIKGYPKEVFEKRLEDLENTREALQKFCFLTRPSVAKIELKRVEKGEGIDWNRERARETYTKKDLGKRFALETLEMRLKGVHKEIPKELEGLDMERYGSLGLQCFLLEMDELRWLKWTRMWKTETNGADLTAENMMKFGLSGNVPHRTSPHGFARHDNNKKKENKPMITEKKLRSLRQKFWAAQKTKMNGDKSN